MIPGSLERLVVQARGDQADRRLTVEFHLRGGSVITLDIPPKVFHQLVTALICLVPSPGREDRMEWEA